jgi:hypothetical protein
MTEILLALSISCSIAAIALIAAFWIKCQERKNPAMTNAGLDIHLTSISDQNSRDRAISEGVARMKIPPSIQIDFNGNYFTVRAGDRYEDKLDTGEALITIARLIIGKDTPAELLKTPAEHRERAQGFMRITGLPFPEQHAGGLHVTKEQYGGGLHVVEER